MYSDIKLLVAFLTRGYLLRVHGAEAFGGVNKLTWLVRVGDVSRFTSADGVFRLVD